MKRYETRYETRYAYVHRSRTYTDPFARKLPSAHTHRVMLVTRLRPGIRLQRLRKVREYVL